jgi:cytochrome oxidase Cu insertion factor (SCO1/SenC/PrrC family)
LHGAVRGSDRDDARAGTHDNLDDRVDGQYLVDHSAQIWLLSPDGELSMFLPMGSDGNDLANDIRWLLNRGA